VGQFRGTELVGLTLAGPRVALRPWLPSDADAVYTAMQEPRMRRFLKVPDPYSQGDAEYFVTDFGHRLAAAGRGLELAVTDAETGALLGAAAVRLPSEQVGDDDAADIGYWIAPQAQGQSYAAEASGVLAQWALQRGVRRAEIRCDVVNLASARTALRAGFAFESIRRLALDVRGKPRDAAVFVRTAASDGQPIGPVFPALPAGGITDGVIQIRVTLPVDAPAMTEMESDDVSVAVGFTGEVPTLAHYAEVTDRAALGWLVGPISAQMSILDVATGEFAGSIQLRHAGPPKVAGIGYGVHPGYRGRGYTARALRLLSAWAFEHGGYARLELGAKARNVASQRAAVSGGFVPDGVRAARLKDADGAYSDEVRFALVSPLITRVRE
jgi:RimJ/RimL family protein N-acetyltransferase